MEPEVALEVGNVVNLIRKDGSTEGPYLINFLSNEMLELADPTGRKMLPIREGVVEAPPGVVSMSVIYTPPKPGYVALIGAQQGSLVDIVLNDESVVRGIVYGIQNDMLELSVNGGTKTIFLDFAYRGIDPNWGIKAVRVVTQGPEGSASPSPEELPVVQEEEDSGPDVEDIPSAESLGESATPEEDLDEFERALDAGVVVGDVSGRTTPPQYVRVQQDIVKAGKIKFIGQLGEVSQKVAASEQEQRHSLPEQVQNLLDSLLAEHPSNPDPRVLQGIQRQINRFRVLYKDNTQIGGNGVALGNKPILTSTHPLATALANPDFSTFWLLPTSAATKKFYNTLGAEEVGGIEADTIASVEAQLAAEETAQADQPPYPKGRVAGVIMASSSYLQPYTLGPEDSEEGEEVAVRSARQNVIVAEGTDESYAVGEGSGDEGGLHLIPVQTRRVVPTAEYSRQVPGPLGDTIIESEPVGAERKVVRTGFMTLGTDGARDAELVHGSIYDRASAAHERMPYIERHMRLVKHGKTTTDAAEPEPGVVAFRPNLEDYSTYLKRISQSAGNLVEILFWPRPANYGPTNLSIVQSRMTPFGTQPTELPFEANLVLRLKMQEAVGALKSEAARRMAAFQRYSNMRPQAFRKYSLENKFAKEVLRTYKLRNNSLLLPSLAKILAVDGGNSLYASVANDPINRMLVDGDRRALTAAATDASSEADVCESRPIAKHYETEEEMRTDLQSERVFYDSDKDPVDTSVLADVPRPDGVDDNQYAAILEDYLTGERGMGPEEAETTAERLLAGGTEVDEGAFFSVGPLNQIYTLRSGEPMLMERMTATANGKNICIASDIECVAGEDACETVKTQTNDALKRAFARHSEIEAMTRQEAFQGLQDEELYGTSRAAELEKLYREKSRLGLGDLAAVGATEERAPMSPHLPLLQAIMAQGDFATKQTDILRFEREFTQPGPTPWMRLCVETSVPLLPTFLVELANAFMRDEYSQALDKICAVQGRLSDMGDAWIDVHSGFVIKRIEDVADPLLGATDELPEATQVSLSALFTEEPVSETSGEVDVARQVVKGVAAALGLQISNAQFDFVQGQVAAGLATRLPNRTDYEARRKRTKAKTGKTLPSYDFVSENMTVMISLSALLVSLQTADAPHRIRRVIAGCPRTLQGYPLNPDPAEMTAIRTLACTVNRIKTDNLPWSTLAKTGEEALMKQLKKFIDLMIESPSVAGKLEQKRAAVEVGEQEGTDEGGEHPLPPAVWPGFLPPVDPTASVPPPKSPSTRPFHSNVPYHAYYEYNVGFKVQAHELKAVQKSKPVRITTSGMPYTYNACCPGTDIRPKNMEYLVQVSEQSSAMRLRTVKCIKAESVLLTRNTRPVFPPAPREFSAETKQAIVERYCGGDGSESAVAEAADACFKRGGRVSDILDSVYAASVVAEPTPARVTLPKPAEFTDKARGLAEVCLGFVRASKSASYQSSLKPEFDRAVELYTICDRDLRQVIERAKLSRDMRAKVFTNLDRLLNTSSFYELVDAMAWSGRVWPAIIANNLPSQAPQIGAHLGLSQRHKKDIQNLSVKQLEAFLPFYDAKTLIPLLQAAHTSPSLVTLVERTNQLVSAKQRYEGATKEMLLTIGRIGTLLSLDFMRFAAPGAALPKQLGPLIAILIDQSLSHIQGTWTALENLRRRLLVAKEKEKNQITDFLKDMSDEQREIENLMKNNKLGKWAKGQSKEIYSYTKDAYDSEMAALEESESDDVQLQDALGRVRVGTEIAEFYADPDVREALDMSGLPEDDDFGDRDGDEDF
jgi:hypothetical protein